MPAVNSVVIAAATCGCVAAVAAALAAVYAWHRLRGPVPLVTWATSLQLSPRREDTANLEEVLTSFKVPKNGMVQVTRNPAMPISWQCTLSFLHASEVPARISFGTWCVHLK